VGFSFSAYSPPISSFAQLHPSLHASFDPAYFVKCFPSWISVCGRPQRLALIDYSF